MSDTACESREPCDRIIKGLLFEVTCGMCPEQYDVTNGCGRLVGYVRLRHGQFRVDCPNCGGTTVLCEDLDCADGAFESEEDRAEWLGKAALAIKKYNKEGEF